LVVVVEGKTRNIESKRTIRFRLGVWRGEGRWGGEEREKESFHLI